MSTMGGPAVGHRFASLSEHTVTKLRIRWFWVVVLAALGAALGFLLTRGSMIFESVAAVQFSVDTQDSTRVKQVAQTMERTALSASVLDEAAATVGTTGEDLGPRVVAEWQSETDIVNITVQGERPRGVALEANAVAKSVKAFYDRTTKAQLQKLGAEGNELLTSGRLRDADAEAARRSGLGAAVAAEQGAAVYGGARLSLLDPAAIGEATGLSRPVALFLGGFAGTALGSVAILLLPFRRFRVSRASEVAALLPGVRSFSGRDNGPAEVAGLFLERECTDLAVVALEGTRDAAVAFAHDVTALLQAHGVSVSMLAPSPQVPVVTKGVHAVRRGAAAKVQSDRPPGNYSTYAFLGRSGRATARREADADALVLLTPATTESLALLAGQGNVFAVVMARAGRHSLEELEAVTRRLRHSEPTVVLVP